MIRKVWLCEISNLLRGVKYTLITGARDGGFANLQQLTIPDKPIGDLGAYVTNGRPKYSHHYTV